MQRDDLVIRRVRAHGPAAEAIPSRHWLDESLRSVVDRLPGLEAEATLLVRHVRHLRAPPVRRGSTGSTQLVRWRGALRDHLSDLARDAARPARGPVPAAAAAVVFADDAELLACLASDWLEGTLDDRWWWRALRGGGDLTAAMLSVWSARPRQVPSAIEALAGRGVQLAFVERLSPADVQQLTRALAREWGLPWLVEAAARARTHSDRAGTPSARDGQATTAAVRRPPLDRPAAAPWRAIAPEVPSAGLAHGAQLLLGIALMLGRAPAVALAPSTAAHVDGWLRAVERDDPEGEADRRPAAVQAARQQQLGARVPTARERRSQRRGDPTRPPAASRPEAAGYAPSDVPPTIVELASATQPSEADPAVVLANLAPAAAPSGALPDTGAGPVGDHPPIRLHDHETMASAAVGLPPDDGRHRRTEVLDAAGPGRHDAHRPRGETQPAVLRRGHLGPSRPAEPAAKSVDTSSVATADVQHPRLAGQVRPGPQDDRLAPVPADPWAGPARAVTTELGGVFYLLRAALHIGHYRDFASPVKPGLALSPWDWLALVATQLLPRARRRDPVWALLAELAGRSPTDPPGRGFRPPRAWRVPPGWLDAVPDRGSWSWGIANQRLVVRHPLRFSIVDVPVAGDPQAQLARELRRYGTHGVVAAEVRQWPTGRPAPWRLTHGLARWRALTGEYVQARLRAALAAPRRTAVGPLVVRHRARIRASSQRVDVWLSLDELPVAIRAAGLDLDPGWIPAAGRSVAFHYD